MKKLGALILMLVALAYLAAFVVRLDPDEQRPGTRLTGEKSSNLSPDWSGLTPRELIAVQTNTWYGIPHSVTTTTFVVDGELYVPCARCPEKRWPENVAEDNRVVIQVQGKLFDRRAVRVTDPELRAAVFGDRINDELYLYHMAQP